MAALLLLLAVPGVWAVQILPGQGITFSQVNYTWPGAVTQDSGTGQIDVDVEIVPLQLQSTKPTKVAYVNVRTSLGWVVQNLPVFFCFPYRIISTNFGLGVTPGTNVTSLLAYVDLSEDPVVAFPGGAPVLFPVGDVNYNAQGKGTGGPVGIPVAPPAEAVAFLMGGPIRGHFQAGHKVIETAQNQCGPAAAASSLQYLEDTCKIKVPHDHKMGLRTDVPNDSLVGQLEEEMDRNVTDRATGDPVEDRDYVEGKLSYLGKNGKDLKRLIVKHQDDDFGDQNITKEGVTSRGRGKVPTFDFLFNELRRGEDVEMGFTYKAGGGHWVEVVGAGTILGKPWVAHVSDYEQTASDGMGGFINDDKGTDRVDFSFLEDTDGDGLLNLIYGKADANVDILVSQSCPKVKQAHRREFPPVLPPEEPVRLRPINSEFLGYLGHSADDVATAVPGILAIEPGLATNGKINWSNFVGAANPNSPGGFWPGGYRIQNVILKKETPEVFKCSEMFPKKVVLQQGTPNIRLWWPLMYEVPGTTWTLSIQYATAPILDPNNPGQFLQYDDDGPGPRPPSAVHSDTYHWGIDADLPGLQDLLVLFHELPFGRAQVPLISNEGLFEELMGLLVGAEDALAVCDTVTAAELLGAFEMLVADVAITSKPAKPYPGGAGTGIANTAENPAACKLIVDADYIGTVTGIFLQNK